jgi:hypothetical protein
MRNGRRGSFGVECGMDGCRDMKWSVKVRIDPEETSLVLIGRFPRLSGTFASVISLYPIPGKIV